MTHSRYAPNFSERRTSQSSEDRIAHGDAWCLARSPRVGVPSCPESCGSLLDFAVAIPNVVATYRSDLVMQRSLKSFSIMLYGNPDMGWISGFPSTSKGPREELLELRCPSRAPVLLVSCGFPSCPNMEPPPPPVSAWIQAGTCILIHFIFILLSSPFARGLLNAWNKV